MDHESLLQPNISSQLGSQAWELTRKPPVNDLCLEPANTILNVIRPEYDLNLTSSFYLFSP